MASIVLATVWCLAGTSSAGASCVGPFGPGGSQTIQQQLDKAAAVFVGKVIATSSNDRVARVQVESVWRGEHINATVTVSGAEGSNGAVTSVDRTFTTGQTYLFAPYSASSPFKDNSCSLTRPYSGDLAQLKPADAHAPDPGSDGLDQNGTWPGYAWAAMGVGVLAVGLVVGALLWRRRR